MLSGATTVGHSPMASASAVLFLEKMNTSALVVLNICIRSMNPHVNELQLLNSRYIASRRLIMRHGMPTCCVHLLLKVADAAAQAFVPEGEQRDQEP